MFPRSLQNPRRSGFTLVELMISIAIIAVMASFVLVALAGVTEKAREDRTKAQIAKINELIMEKWESYLYRRMPPALVFGQYPENMKAALSRLNAVREMMRMELPDHLDDVLKPARMLRDPLTKKPYEPTLWRAYRARAQYAKAATGVDWTSQHEGAECLYLILSQMREADSSALESFSENEIGDVDGDGMKEILDAWGMPIRWLRWAPGHLSPFQRRLSEDPEQDDMFDMAKVGTGYSVVTSRPRALYPLIYSAGPDNRFGIISATEDDSTGEGKNSWYAARNDPYDTDETRKLYLLGAVSAFDPDAHADDITNHLLTTR